MQLLDRLATLVELLAIRLGYQKTIAKSLVMIPPPRRHRHRYYGVLAPNSPQRNAVTALAVDPAADKPKPPESNEQDASAISKAARYTWPMLIARIYDQRKCQSVFAASAKIFQPTNFGVRYVRCNHCLADAAFPAHREAGSRSRPHAG